MTARPIADTIRSARTKAVSSQAKALNGCGREVQRDGRKRGERLMRGKAGEHAAARLQIRRSADRQSCSGGKGEGSRREGMRGQQWGNEEGEERRGEEMRREKRQRVVSVVFAARVNGRMRSRHHTRVHQNRHTDIQDGDSGETSLQQSSIKHSQSETACSRALFRRCSEGGNDRTCHHPTLCQRQKRQQQHQT